MPVHRADVAKRIHAGSGRAAMAAIKLSQSEQQHDTETQVDGHHQLGQAERETDQR